MKGDDRTLRGRECCDKMSYGMRGGIVARDCRWREDPGEKRADSCLSAEETLPETVYCLLRATLHEDITERFRDGYGAIDYDSRKEFPDALCADGQPSERGGKKNGKSLAASFSIHSTLAADDSSSANPEIPILVTWQKSM
jgi:hypothetical protein